MDLYQPSQREIDRMCNELERLLAAAHHRMDELGMPRLPRRDEAA